MLLLLFVLVVVLLPPFLSHLLDVIKLLGAHLQQLVHLLFKLFSLNETPGLLVLVVQLACIVSQLQLVLLHVPVLGFP